MNDPTRYDETDLPTSHAGEAPYDRSHAPLRRGSPRRHGLTPSPPLDPVRDPLRSTTAEDIERADGEGMCPVPPPRPHIRG